MEDRQKRLLATLDRLTGQPGILGATLVTRDGISVVTRGAPVGSPETFAAMSAALLGAAETALYELGGGSRVRVTAETDKYTMVAVGATEELLLVLVAEAGTSLDAALKLADDSVKRIEAVTR
ncbi:MAG: roadblock/LC7 domain-containing protein [Methanobacteriota archaeon]